MVVVKYKMHRGRGSFIMYFKAKASEKGFWKNIRETSQMKVNVIMQNIKEKIGCSGPRV